MLIQVKTPQEHTTHGRTLVSTGGLTQLRERLGLTRSAMAELLHMSPVTYIRCEDPGTAFKMWASTAERLGRFAYLARITMERLESEGIYLSELTPLHIVARDYAFPQELLLSWFREGCLLAEDLGILGVWIRKADLWQLQENLSATA